MFENEFTFQYGSTLIPIDEEVEEYENNLHSNMVLL